MRIGDKVRIKSTFPLQKFKNQSGTIEDIEVFKSYSDEYVTNVKVKFDNPIGGSFGGSINWHWFDVSLVEEVE